ncbi:MAG: metal-dependent hydrolase [Cyclobacteriaceae bacterium]|nr:metal-dependent hydrolase [Cyclobacteriaceae bacterium]
MDSITHIAIGALIGDALMGKTLGKRALILGAAFQSIPDIDFICSFFLSPTENLLAHRGLTHSFMFGVFITLILAWFIKRWQRSPDLDIKKWMWFIGIEVFVHLLLDSLNAYGVGWFEPFSNKRFSFHVIFVADPLYSIWLGIACLGMLLVYKNYEKRKRFVFLGLVVSSLYLCVCLVNKAIINKRIESTFSSKGIEWKRYFATPTAFNNMLWYCVVEMDSSFYIGYSSIWDASPEISFSQFDQQRYLIENTSDDKEIENLIQFSNGYFTVERLEGEALLFNDLRFGRIAGWQNQPSGFSFHYYLKNPDKNLLVIQRGRYAEWNVTTMKSLAIRMMGN